MSDKLQIFENPDFGQVRVLIDEDNNPLFAGVDVARVLGYKRAGEAVATHCKSSGTVKHRIPNSGNLGSNEITFIDEANLYRLIMKSQLESVERFQDWVFEEVLPSIRKTGQYSLQNRVPQTFAQVLRAYADEVEKNEMLKLENTQQKQIIGELQPKAVYYDEILKSKDCLTITQIAKDYGMSGHQLNQFLSEQKIQYKQSKQWLLYSNYHREGYTKSETVSITRKDGSVGSVLHTKWTQKGRLFLYELLKRNNILPLIEQEL
jgi:hypothetical protein|nr:MAG TPA: repressor domain protein [Caudoviricetes sp.]